MNKIYEIYEQLHNNYGPQGWWPILEHGYHKGDYTFPRCSDEIFEVCLGSILTQNTTFTSVVKSLENLHAKGAINPRKIENMDIKELKEAIRPSGYYNQKALYILEFIKFYKSLDGKTPAREALLSVKGIGEETADSMLLYGYKEPEFKVDAYTKRLLIHLGLANEKTKYTEIKQLMQNSIKEVVCDKENLLRVYQELHAMIVEHGKKYYSKKPYGVGCFLVN